MMLGLPEMSKAQYLYKTSIDVKVSDSCEYRPLALQPYCGLYRNRKLLACQKGVDIGANYCAEMTIIKIEWEDASRTKVPDY